MCLPGIKGHSHHSCFMRSIRPAAAVFFLTAFNFSRRFWLPSFVTSLICAIGRLISCPRDFQRYRRNWKRIMSISQAWQQFVTLSDNRRVLTRQSSVPAVVLPVFLDIFCFRNWYPGNFLSGKSFYLLQVPLFLPGQQRNSNTFFTCSACPPDTMYI